MSRASGNIEPLTKENFYKWRVQIQMLLNKNNTWEYVSGEKIRTAENATEWDVADRKARSDIILAISPEALMKVYNCNTSKEVWDKLNEIYCLTYPAYKSMLIKQLIDCKMQEDGNMNSHIKNFSNLIDKLREIHVYIHDDIITVMLLRSIPNSYEDFRVAIESAEIFPSFEVLKTKLLQEELKRRQNQEYENNTYYSGNRIGHAIGVSRYPRTATRRTIQTITPSISHQVLYEEIINILRGADYRTITLKTIRLMIETKYNIHLNNREREIYFLAMQYVKGRREMEHNDIIEDTEDETESESDDEKIEEE